ncbi:MAG: 2,4-dihydroxyhept-2-ene-1,7-dioic acid aldolase [Planctomycetaceae bacterium]|nr:2,4-dihydroxyhept-2-ene-1,7-dioic acid aldolase [Planctomycetaceae bacterium]
MTQSSFRSRLLNKECLIGTMVTLPTASTAEILADAGFDWLFIDAEHGPLEISSILSILQSVGHRIPCLIRIASCDEIAIKKVLDLGATGIIVPQTNSLAQVKDSVRFAKYPPEGSRGVGLARAHGYGFRFNEYIESANRETVVVVQAEHKSAVECIEETVRVPGIDGVLLGPYDLSASMDRMGQINHPDVVAAIDRVTDACRSSRVPLGYFGVTAEAVSPYIEKGYSLIVAGVDVLFLGQSARKMAAELKQ